MFNKKEINDLENECYNLRNEINYLKKSIQDICPHKTIGIELATDLKTTFDENTCSFSHDFDTPCTIITCDTCGFEVKYFKGSKEYTKYLKEYTKLKKKELEELK